MVTKKIFSYKYRSVTMRNYVKYSIQCQSSLRLLESTVLALDTVGLVGLLSKTIYNGI